MGIEEPRWGAIAMWAIDFIRAYSERPRIFRWIMRRLMGKYAYRELLGLRDSLEADGHSTDFWYGLENMDYHKEPSAGKNI